MQESYKMSMIRKAILLFVLVVATLQFCMSETNRSVVKDKSIAGGVLLGSIGILGIFVPGTFGWGNFYARDYVGFAILNIGGSSLTVLTWAMSASLVIQYGSKYPTNAPQNIIGATAVFGTIVFAIASIISGGASVDRHNLLNKINEKNSFLVIPKTDGLAIELSHYF